MMIRLMVHMAAAAWLLFGAAACLAGGYPVVDTGQSACFDDARQIVCPQPGQPFYGQDAQYRGNPPTYRDNNDGTVTDLVTGLMWVKVRGPMLDWDEAMAGAARCRVGGYEDWRAPTIKELYSLIDFNGWVQRDAASSTPYIATRFFEFVYGDQKSGERLIDCQDWSATEYLGTTMRNNATVFGVNFADGRIKGYPKSMPQGPSRRYVRYVRGNPEYGRNRLTANGDGTVTDAATGLLWQQADDGETRDWEHALGYCENLVLAGRDDWRLPSVKELQSIVDYGRSPTATGSAAIDPIFSVSATESYYQSSTTHLDGPNPDRAAYVAFGRAMGFIGRPGGSGTVRLTDVHGAGAQRSDPKSGDPGRFPQGHGPQGDDIRITNYVRCVTGGGVTPYAPPNLPMGRFAGGPESERGPGRGMDNGMNQERPAGQGRKAATGPSMHGAPPPRAVTACAGKPANAACAMETPHGTVDGLCRERNGETFCVPARRPGGPPPGP
jgi:hypothetical protein